MKRYNAIIVEDELHVREALLSLIIQNCPQVHICGLAGSAQEAREILAVKQVDFIFLDIAMPQEDGFEFLDSIPKEKYGIIFTTAYHEYALRAIKANAVDYLLKPINPAELREAVSKAIFYHELRSNRPDIQKVYNDSISNLRENVKQKDTDILRITVTEQFGFRVIDVPEIMYLVADSNYTVFHLANRDKVMVTKNLGEFEKIVVDVGFFRIHKSTIINVVFLLGYSSHEGNFAEMKDGTKWTISRRKINDFRSWVRLYTLSVE